MSSTKPHKAVAAVHGPDINKIRADFPILSRKVYGKPLVYLDNAATSQKPASVIKALSEYYEGYNANVHRGVHALSMEATDRYEEARRKVAKFIGARHEESIIWTRGATEAINLVAYTWAQQNIKPGDEIVLTPMEHHSNLVPWQKVAADKGAKIKFFGMTGEQTLDLSNVDEVITPRTKLVAIVHGSNSLGTINPVKELTAKAHAVGATVLVDGAQSVPHMPIDVEDIGCDFLAFSGHKMAGPTGIGALYARPELLQKMEPFMRGGDMVLEVSYESASWNAVPAKFEAGTPNIADAIGLAAAVDYLSAIGMENIRRHEMELTAYALKRFDEIADDVKVFGPRDVRIRGGVVPFHSPDVHPHDLGTFLDREGIAIRTGHHCTMPLIRKLEVPATARASFYLYNTQEEVDILVEALKRALRYFVHGVNRA
ncbi:MAG: cysteine desulfurase [SAR202 cluster bacterium]|nr:cysteine desulfurase [SAR202 cluster bacterium]